jgi:hypothetical protein
LFHTEAKFFYLQEARKIHSTLHTGANFSILSGGKLEKFERVIRNGPHEGVRPNDDEMGLVKE